MFSLRSPKVTSICYFDGHPFGILKKKGFSSVPNQSYR